MNCNHNCDNCNSSCGVKCPICGSASIAVPGITVVHLTKNVKVNDINKDYHICINRSCNVAYFDDNGNTIDKSNVNVPIWFKEKFQKYIVCYCENITLEDVFEAVAALKDKSYDIITKEDIYKYYNKKHNHTAYDCLIRNPIGKSCDRLMENAIEAALENISNKNK